VQDSTALIQLGKAFFWDMQMGSDGVQACASCHFQAGADHRIKNALNPGTNATPPITWFTSDDFNYTMVPADYLPRVGSSERSGRLSAPDGATEGTRSLRGGCLHRWPP
jgi:cytochrome c peroxidase